MSPYEDEIPESHWCEECNLENHIELLDILARKKWNRGRHMDNGISLQRRHCIHSNHHNGSDAYLTAYLTGSMANSMNNHQSVEEDPVIPTDEPQISIYGKKDFQASFWHEDEDG
ncbi:hypothetical protein HDV63DRAFT_388546 [Trichoderma sp. SZMC 28014]